LKSNTFETRRNGVSGGNESQKPTTEARRHGEAKEIFETSNRDIFPFLTSITGLSRPEENGGHGEYQNFFSGLEEFQ
jgi:hypothetical protein